MGGLPYHSRKSLRIKGKQTQGVLGHRLGGQTRALPGRIGQGIAQGKAGRAGRHGQCAAIPRSGHGQNATMSPHR